MRAKKFFVCSDPHVLMVGGKVGGIDTLTNNAVVKFIEDEGPWDGYVNAGDHFDMNVVSDHNKGKLKLVEGQRLFDDYRAGNAVLQQHYIAAGSPGKFYLLEGNHEDRVRRYIDAKPELEGIVNVEKFLPDFVTYIKYWSKHEILKLGRLNIIHGVGTASGQCRKALTDYGRNTLMGHSHRREVVAMRYHGDDETKIAESIPVLCEYRQPYLNNRPTAWSQGFVVLYLWPDGRFNHFVVSVFDHGFISPSGKYYNGRKMRPETRIVL